VNVAGPKFSNSAIICKPLTHCCNKAAQAFHNHGFSDKEWQFIAVGGRWTWTSCVVVSLALDDQCRLFQIDSANRPTAEFCFMQPVDFCRCSRWWCSSSGHLEYADTVNYLRRWYFSKTITATYCVFVDDRWDCPWSFNSLLQWRWIQSSSVWSYNN